MVGDKRNHIEGAMKEGCICKCVFIFPVLKTKQKLNHKSRAGGK